MKGVGGDGEETKFTMTKARQIKSKGQAKLFGQTLQLKRQPEKGKERRRNANLQVGVWVKRS